MPILAILMCACRTVRETSPPVVVTNTDSIVTEYVETVRFDTVRIEIPVPIELSKQTVRDSTSHLETSLAFSEAWINPDGSLGHSIKNKECVMTREIPIAVTDTRTDNIRETVREIPVPYKEIVYKDKDLSRWEAVKLHAFWYLFGISFICLVVLFRKSLLKILKRLS